MLTDFTRQLLQRIIFHLERVTVFFLANAQWEIDGLTTTLTVKFTVQESFFWFLRCVCATNYARLKGRVQTQAVSCCQRQYQIFATRTKSTQARQLLISKGLKMQINISISKSMCANETLDSNHCKISIPCQHTASSKSTSVFLSLSFFWSFSPPLALTTKKEKKKNN